MRVLCKIPNAELAERFFRKFKFESYINKERDHVVIFANFTDDLLIKHGKIASEKWQKEDEERLRREHDRSKNYGP